MGYFDGLANGSFKKDIAGSTIFFPYGALAKGRVLPDEKAEKKVRAFVVFYYKVSLAMIIGVSVFSRILLLALIPILIAWYYFSSKSLISKCPYRDEKLTIKVASTNSALGHSKSFLWFAFISSVSFVVAGIWIAIIASSTKHLIVGLCSIIFFGFCCVFIGYMLKVKGA